MTFGSLFSGIGGFDLGFERAGMECVWQVEINEQARRVLADHWPDVQRHDDVKTFNATIAVRPDLICGGFPCQDLSVAGKRAGLAGERSGLFYEFMRIVGEFAPEWVCIENVPGLLSSNGGRDMGAVLGTLGQLGYGWSYRVLDAQWFGVAQRRRRVFIVGCLGDGRRAAEVLFESDCLPWDSAPSREAGKRVAASLTRGSGVGSNDPGRRREDDVNIVQTLRAEGFDASEDGTGRGTPLIAATLNSGGNNGGFRTEPGEHLVAFAQNQRDELRTMDVAGALAAEPGMKQQTYAMQTMGVRRLMPIECERLQGFPDNWTAGNSDSARYRMLGNAVCVSVAEWIGKRLMEASP